MRRWRGGEIRPCVAVGAAHRRRPVTCSAGAGHSWVALVASRGVATSRTVSNGAPRRESRVLAGTPSRNFFHRNQNKLARVGPRTPPALPVYSQSQLPQPHSSQDSGERAESSRQQRSADRTAPWTAHSTLSRRSAACKPSNLVELLLKLYHLPNSARFVVKVFHGNSVTDIVMRAFSRLSSATTRVGIAQRVVPIMSRFSMNSNAALLAPLQSCDGMRTVQCSCTVRAFATRRKLPPSVNVVRTSTQHRPEFS